MLNNFTNFGKSIEIIGELWEHLITSLNLPSWLIKYLFNMTWFDHFLNQSISSLMCFFEINDNVISHRQVSIYQHLKILPEKRHLCQLNVDIKHSWWHQEGFKIILPITHLYRSIIHTPVSRLHEYGHRIRHAFTFLKNLPVVTLQNRVIFIS